MMNKKEIGKDFKSVINNNWLNNRIEINKEKFKEDFKEHINKKSLNYEFYLKYDFSPEIEESEISLNRKITVDEYEFLLVEYIKKVVKIINKK